ncbi:MAG: TauD/TfdA family dioxygenase [Dongiaceae bacterium]
MKAEQSLVPDFDTYPITQRVLRAEIIPDGILVHWQDGLASPLHKFWLRENSPDAVTMHPESREQQLLLTDMPDDLQAAEVAPTADGGLYVRWTPDGQESRYHPGWLRAHVPSLAGQHSALPARQTWSAATLGALPRFAAAEIATDDAAFGAWLEAIHIHGIALLSGLPSEPEVIFDIPAKIGPIRETNFGRAFDVKTDGPVTSNAFTALALPVHTDLCTREYLPGLQFLHCLRNDANGGESILVDGFKIAEVLRQESPDLYETLSSQPVIFANKARDTDYRFAAPMLAHDRNGDLMEVRLSPWLRAPLTTPFEVTDKLYRGLRRFLRLCEDPAYRLVYRLQPGDMLAFDNRRLLHGRLAFDQQAGTRWLRGCYVELEELHSRLRILGRQRRQAALAPS